MNKKAFINYFKNIEQYELLKLYEKFIVARNKGITVFTNEFYTPDIWNSLENIDISDININSYGIFPSSDRRIIAFNNSCGNYPIKLLKIECNTKFMNLNHKDYLGAIMSLGIKRNKLGELIVTDNCGFVAVHDDIVDFILNNLLRIKNLYCKCTIIENNEEVPVLNYEAKNIMIASTRIDCIVASLCNISRSKSGDMVERGKILVNYMEIINKNYLVKEKSKITIRGFGKYEVNKIYGTTKNGRLKLNVFKYT